MGSLTPLRPLRIQAEMTWRAAKEGRWLARSGQLFEARARCRVLRDIARDPNLHQSLILLAVNGACDIQTIINDIPYQGPPGLSEDAS
ncbi:hypothetical protein ASD32_04085 [Rhizobium sp. Root483D2]|nr:hypothetical protein ASD32_04085 [Rhizobium sp. Root483D2]